VLVVLVVIAAVIVLVAALSFGGWDRPTVIRRTIIRRPVRRVYEEPMATRRVYEEPAPRRVYEDRPY